MSKENDQNSRLSSNWLFLKLFDGHKERQFWQLYWNYFTKIWTFLTQSEKLIQKYMFLKKYFFFAKDCSGHEECIFDIPADKSSAVVKVFLLWKSKKLEEIVYCSGKCFLSKNLLDTRNAALTTLPIFSLDSNFFSTRSPKKWIEHIHFSANWFFLEVFHWHKECSSDNPPDEVLLKSFFFGWKLERDESKCSFFSKKIFLKVFPGLKKCSFDDNSPGKNERNPKFFSQSSETIENLMSSSKKLFFLQCYSRHG